MSESIPCSRVVLCSHGDEHGEDLALSALLYLACLVLLSASTYQACENSTDCQALLKFKDGITHDPEDYLRSWNTGNPFCNWSGVTCHTNTKNRVEEVDLRTKGLEGSISPFLFNLSSLTRLSLQGNGFSGAITDARKNEKSFRMSKAKDTVTIFHCMRAPSMSIGQCLERVHKYSGCSASCFVLVHLYINRFLHRTRCYLTYLNVHRLPITSTFVASKFLDDFGYNNAYFAKVGDISTAEINRLEKNFLFNMISDYM
ncbi:hypothetical protein MLD38_016443 [Melastoma candidum]|uniref:Uncharacterized protein n=1 Tax=Melastoma candidum TaxID=119954 RepID=A0ACB9RMJ5_9MYRT|nr:hypothetical protein MLD38_016443 [Melastoma candidum]